MADRDPGGRTDAGAAPVDAWERALSAGLDFLRRRVTGDYPVDEFGFDPEWTTTVALPVHAAVGEHPVRQDEARE